MSAATAGRSADEESTVASRRHAVADRGCRLTRSITRWYGPCTLDTKDRWRVAGCWPAPANLKNVCFVGFSCDRVGLSVYEKCTSQLIFVCF
ncbi:hypothetical protein Y032_0307g2018 [Ancylostoma ceylanicum]|nr:hypothetical protein Y032_0307g2018 [Ancylostoma ceylanicum]